VSAIHALSLIADLFFSMQVEEAARHLGFLVGTVSTPDKAISALGQGRYRLFIMDLTAAGDRVTEVLLAAKAAPYPVAVLAFGPHADHEAHQAAGAADADLVVPKSQFSQDLAKFMIACLDRHRGSVVERGEDA